eukprot:2021763-Amphidinium_carterae.1
MSCVEARSGISELWRCVVQLPFKRKQLPTLPRVEECAAYCCILHLSQDGHESAADVTDPTRSPAADAPDAPPVDAAQTQLSFKQCCMAVYKHGTFAQRAADGVWGTKQTRRHRSIVDLHDRFLEPDMPCACHGLGCCRVVHVDALKTWFKPPSAMSLGNLASQLKTAQDAASAGGAAAQ